MPKDLIASFRSGDELTADLIDAILRELQRLRKMRATPPLAIADGDGLTPPLFWMLEEDALVPFTNATGSDIAEGSLDSPTEFTAKLLRTLADTGAMHTDNALTTDRGRHIMNVAIKSGANGFGVWYGGYFYPVTWDNC